MLTLESTCLIDILLSQDWAAWQGNADLALDLYLHHCKTSGQVLAWECRLKVRIQSSQISVIPNSMQILHQILTYDLLHSFIGFSLYGTWAYRNLFCNKAAAPRSRASISVLYLAELVSTYVSTQLCMKNIGLKGHEPLESNACHTCDGLLTSAHLLQTLISSAPVSAQAG